MDLSFILIVIVCILWTYVTLCQKFTLDKIFSDMTSFIVFTNLSIPIFLIFVFLTKEINFNISFFNLILIIFFGGFFIFFYILYGLALKDDEASKIIPLTSFTTIFILVLELIFFKTQISKIDYSGILIIVLGAFLISSKKIDISIFKPRKTLYLISLYSFSIASYLIFIKYISNIYDFWTFQFFISFGSFLSILLFFLFKNQRMKVKNTFKNMIDKKSILFLLFIFSIDSIGLISVFLYNYVIKISDSVTLTNALVNLFFIFIFIVGTTLSKLFPKHFYEDISKKELVRKLFSTILIIVGVILIQVI